jgi:hypothetical protein
MLSWWYLILSIRSLVSVIRGQIAMERPQVKGYGLTTGFYIQEHGSAAIKKLKLVAITSILAYGMSVDLKYLELELWHMVSNEKYATHIHLACDV